MSQTEGSEITSGEASLLSTEIRNEAALKCRLGSESTGCARRHRADRANARAFASGTPHTLPVLCHTAALSPPSPHVRAFVASPAAKPGLCGALDRTGPVRHRQAEVRAGPGAA